MSIRISVVMCCLDEAAAIGHQLGALAGQACDESWELVVADNGSTDGTQDIVRGFAGRIPQLRLVDASDRRGVAHARNAGAAAAAGEAIVYCDADDEVGEGWLQAMADALREHDFVACRVDFDRLNPPQVRRGRRSTQWDGLQACRYPPFLPHAGGGTIGVTKAVYRQVGGFDESLMVTEDTDFCWRVQLAGVALHFVPGAVMHVRLQAGPDATCRQASIWAAYNVLLYKRYHHEWHVMPRIPPLSGLRNWLGLLRRSYLYFDPERRGQWLWEASWAYGRLVGSWRHRVFAL